MEQTKEPSRKRRRLYEPLNDEQAETQGAATVKGKLTEDARAARYEQALQIINKHICWSAGAGLIPIPVLDVAALTGIDIKMLNELSRLYDIPFAENRAKSIVAALIGSVSAFSVPKGVLGACFWMIPLIGPALYLLLSPIAAGAATYAVGKVFVQHFEFGGTLLTFNPDETKAFFAEQFRAGKEYVTQLRK
jgi:uncharacterized protein (DUF697 family)